MATMNLADPELELVDPTPNVHTLFIHFDQMFFSTRLASRAVVRWSKRMYSCAGVCSYEGRGGLCDIALSEPLLKLRPRKDLIETLLHEMIHAFLFVTNRDQNRDGHGPNFKAHMYRINKAAGLNISIYHSFHDEVELYQTHWWRCNGPCQKNRPHFGIVRRTCNRAPGPNDYWWCKHQRQCGGTFIKIKEPESKATSKKATKPKNKGDITKFVTGVPTKPVLKDANINTLNTINTVNTKTKSNSANTLVVSKKGVVYNPTVIKKPASQPIPVFTGSGKTLSGNKPIFDSRSVTEQVRNIWLNKQIPPAINNSPPTKHKTKEPEKVIGLLNPNKHKIESTIKSPPAKIKKIDEYFKATSLLKDLYGKDYNLTKPQNSSKLVAVTGNNELVDCPICGLKVDSNEINKHLDECLNKDVIEKLSKESQTALINPSQNVDKPKEIIGNVPQIPAFKPKQESSNNNVVDLTNLNNYFQDDFSLDKHKAKRNTDSPANLQAVEMDRVNSLTKEMLAKKNKTSNRSTKSTVEPVFQSTTTNLRKSDNFVTHKKGDSIKIETAIKTEKPTVDIKIEPSTSKIEIFEHTCPCCGKIFDKPVEEHLDECIVFDNSSIPEEGQSTSYINSTIVIDEEEDDVFDESQVFNATGTKTPCPCCMKMVEQADMNGHLDICLGIA